MKLRAWWHLHSDPKNMPRDVREYIIRRYLDAAIEEAKTPEQRVELASKLIAGALTLGPKQMGLELGPELIDVGFRLVRGLTGDCAKCGKPIYIHDGVTIEDKLYCKTCRPSA